MDIPLPKIEEMNDILDLKDMEIWDLTWLFAVLITMACLLILWGIYTLWNRRWRKRVSAEEIKSPIDHALDRLNELVGRGLLEAGKVRAFYFTLSEIFRDYLEDELKISANEATLEELKPLLKKISEFTQEESREAYWLLETSDMAKFAKWVPPKEDIVRSVKICRVLMTNLARRLEPSEDSSPDMENNEEQSA